MINRRSITTMLLVLRDNPGTAFITKNGTKIYYDKTHECFRKVENGTPFTSSVDSIVNHFTEVEPLF